MTLLKVICWALIFIVRIRFPPGKSLATISDSWILVSDASGALKVLTVKVHLRDNNTLLYTLR